MPATALTIGLEATLASAVSAYFRKFRVLPPKDLAVGTTRTPQGPASFETLLNAVEADQATDFVVVVHGHSDGSGLFLPLANRNRATVGARTTHDKLQLLMTIAARSPASIDQDDRQRLELRDAEINRMIAVMRRVQAKSIKSIEFRGCNLGRNTSSVGRFRSFFGATSFGAPNLHSFFGLNPTGTGAGLMGSHTSSHDGPTLTFTSTIASKNLHLCIGVNDERKPRNGHIVADDDATIDSWIQRNFDAAATRGQERQLPIHGLWKFPEIDLNDPLQNMDPRPILPLAVDAQGNNEYRAHVVYSP